MADDTQRLVVSLEARIDSFEKALRKAGALADDSTTQIQKKFDNANSKLVRGMSGIGKTALVANDANARLVAGMSQTANGAVAVSHAIGALSTQGMAAFHALRGGAEMLAQGASPMRVLAMEMNNLTYAASGSGGLVGAMKEAIGIFAGLLNPIAALTTGIVGAGLAVIGLGASFASSQSKIDLALTGVGKSAGMTVGQINQIGEAVASTSDLSTSEATDIATAIASTGKVSADTTKKATELAHAYSLVFDKSLDQSAQDLAAALADPAKGIDSLNNRLGAWNAKQVELVKNLTMSGQREKAAKIILDGMQKSIGDAAEKTDFWTRSWNGLTNAISNAITASGKAINEAAGIRTPEDALANAQARLKALQQGVTGPRGGTTFGNPQQIAQATAEVNRLQAAVDKLHKTQNDNQEGIDVSNIVKGVDPTVAKLEELQATIDRIRKAPVLDDASEAVRDKVVKSLQTEHDFLAQNLEIAKQRYGIASSQLAIDAKATALDIAAINARSPAQKAEIAYQQTLQQLLGSGVSQQEAEIEASLARTKSLTQAQHDLSEAQRDRIYQADQSIEQAKLENSTIGLSVDAATTLTQRFQLLAAARAEAHKNGTVVSPAEIAAMDKAAAALGKLAQANAALNVQNNAKFDISQLGRDQSEQNVYGTLQSAGLLDNGQIVSAQAKQTAEILRTREAMSQLADTEKTFAQSFLSDLMQGKSAAASLGDALTAVANKLLDSGIDALIAGATSSGANKSFLSFLGLADGGVFTPGKGLSSLPRFAGGGVSKKAAIFGEAGPEAAVPLPDGRRIPVDLRMPTIAAPAPVSMPPITISIDARNSTPESVDKLSETLAKLPEMIDQRISHQIGRNTAVRKAIRRA